jgi:hypothetical protein
MAHNPLCPNCSRPMNIARTLPEAVSDDAAVNVFECSNCHVSFITEDHLPIAGVVVH